LVFGVLTACSPTPNTGTVVFSEASTGRIATIDVASGDVRLIDGTGTFGSLAISADRQHVAYVGTDSVVRVADSSGSVTTLDPPTGATAVTGCSPGPTWGPHNTLVYCVVDHDYGRYGFMPGPGIPARMLFATDVAISDDGSKIVYHRRASDPAQPGDVVVENADGSDQRVVAASVFESQLEFSPDGQVVVAVAQHPDAFRVVAHSLSDGTTTDLGPGTLPNAIAGGSSFSPDHSEVLAVLGGELVAVTTAGVSRHFATIDSSTTVAQAAFIDADHVIYRRMETTMTPGSDIVSTSSSLRIANASSEVTVVPDAVRDCYVEGIDLHEGVAAVECDTAAIVSFDGTVLVSTEARALGLSEDSSGIVTIADDGSVALVTPNGTHPLAQAMARTAITGLLLSPFAAYAP
jgi:hypothetical protein